MAATGEELACSGESQRDLFFTTAVGYRHEALPAFELIRSESGFFRDFLHFHRERDPGAKYEHFPQAFAIDQNQVVRMEGDGGDRG